MIPPQDLHSPIGEGASGMVFYVHDDDDDNNNDVHRLLHGDRQDEEDLAYITPIGQDANGTFVYSEEDRIILERIEQRRLEQQLYGGSPGRSSSRTSCTSASSGGTAALAAASTVPPEHLVPVRVRGSFKKEPSQRTKKQKKTHWRGKTMDVRGEHEEEERQVRDETCPLCALFICVIFLIVAALGVLLLVITQLPHSQRGPPKLPPSPPVQPSDASTGAGPDPEPSQSQDKLPSTKAPTTPPPSPFPSVSPTPYPTTSPTSSLAPTISAFVKTSKVRFEQGETIRGRFSKHRSRSDLVRSYLSLVKLAEQEEEMEHVVATIRVCEECQNATTSDEGVVFRFDESSFFRDGYSWPLPVGSYHVAMRSIQNEGYSRSNQHMASSDVIVVQPRGDGEEEVVTTLTELVENDHSVLFPSKVTSSDPTRKWTNQGVTIRVQFDKGQNTPSYADDWIGLYRVHTHTDESHDEEVLLAWLYACGSQDCDHNQASGMVDFNDYTMARAVTQGRWPLSFGRYRAKLWRDYHREDEPPLLESTVLVGMAPETPTASIYTEKLYYDIGESIVFFFNNGGPSNGAGAGGPPRQRRLGGGGGGKNRSGGGGKDKGGRDQSGGGSSFDGGSGGGGGNGSFSGRPTGNGATGGGPPAFWVGIWRTTSDTYCPASQEVPETYVYTCGNQLCATSTTITSPDLYSPRFSWITVDSSVVGTGQWPLAAGLYCAALTKGEYRETGVQPRTTTVEFFHVQ